MNKLFALLLSASSAAADSLDIELIDGKFLFPCDTDLRPGCQAFAIEYDPSNDGFAMIDDMSTRDDVAFHHVTSSAILDGNDTTFGYQASFDHAQFIASRSSPLPTNYRTLAVHGSYFYALDGFGAVTKIEVSTKNVVDVITFFPFFTGSPQLPGLCIDETSETLYVIDARSVIYSVYLPDFENVDEDNLEDIAFAAYGSDADGANPRTLHPTDCTVVDGKIYFVENQFTADIVVYDIAENEWMYHRSNVANAVSIESYDGNLIVLTQGSNVLVAEISEIAEEDSFEEVLQIAADGRSFGLDLAVDDVNGILAIDTWRANALHQRATLENEFFFYRLVIS